MDFVRHFVMKRFNINRLIPVLNDPICRVTSDAASAALNDKPAQPVSPQDNPAQIRRLIDHILHGILTDDPEANSTAET